MKWIDEKISAPYLTYESGMFFKGIGDFSEKLSIFLHYKDKFSPQEYVLRQFTNEIATKKLLDIILSK